MQIPKMLTPEYQELLEKCVHCGLCLQACPTYTIFGTEMDAPRGRIALMRAAVEGRISQEEFLTTFAEHMTLCLECRACETACPSGVPYGKLIEGARIALEEVRDPGPVERFVRWLGMVQLMPHVGQMKALARLMWLYERLGLQWLVRTFNILPKPLNAMEGILPPLADRYPDYSQPAPAHGEKRGVVAFFYGCIQEAFLSSINAATVRVLQRNGYEVHFPQTQTCCGAAQWHTGGEKVAQELARQNIEAFEPYDVVVNNAGGCGLTLKEYPDLLRDDPDYAERAKVFAAKVQDFSEFLDAHLHVPPTGELRVRATYSDSCHLRHGQGVIEQPRALLRTIPGFELVELRDPDRCCGSAGIYNIVQSETANAVLDAKMEDIAATGAEIVVTSNTGCHMQLLAGVRRARLNAKVLHIAEMLDLSYSAGERRNGGTKAEHKLNLRLTIPVKHPKPLFGQPALPERWLMWQAKRLRRDDETPLASLKAHLQPGQVIDNPVELLTYVVDGGIDQGTPLGVVFPYNAEDVQTIVRWGRAHGVPIVPRGAGTGLAGGAVALRGGLLLAFSHMKDLVVLDRLGRSAVVQPGIVNLVLDETVKAEGLFFPPDPASGRAATVGGNIGANAGGPHCFKYGVTTNYVTGLDVVLADGRAVRLGGRALDYPGVDLVGLMTGAEGTLGVITEASVRLLRNPPDVKTLLAAFDSVAEAGEAVSAVIAAGLMPATMEMMGQRMMQTIEEYNHPGLPVEAGAALIIDVDGYPDSVQPQLEEVASVLRENRARELRVARSENERTQIWYARKSAVGALARLAVDHYTVDGTVPRSKLAETLREVIRICEELDLEVLFLLHAGDGNLHPLVLVPDPKDEAFLARLHEGGRRMSELFVAQGGTISGEHGIGIEKQEFMPLMYGDTELAAMHEIKEIFDPDELLNPDKIFPKGKAYGACTLIEEAVPDESRSGTVRPKSPEEVSATICSLAAAGQPFRVRGGGTKSTLFRETAVALSTVGLAGIREYAPDDLYVTVGAGTPLVDLQRTLAKDNMWVPLVSPWPEATVGGIAASGFNAPLRMRYGAIRDLVQAMTVVLGDGRVLRLGRPVMKNVAGYDLVKLFIGSYGVLGVITDITLKLSPRPRVEQTLAVPVPTLGKGVAWASRLSQKALVASAVLLGRGLVDPSQIGLPVGADPGVEALMLLYTASGLPEDVTAELLEVRQTLSDLAAPEPVLLGAEGREPDASGSELWASWMADVLPERDGVLLVRLGVAPRDLPEVLRMLASDLGAVRFVADAPNGHLYLRGILDLAHLRSVAQDLGGYVAVLRARHDNPLNPAHVWGYRPEALDRVRAIKAQWDPAGVLNPDTLIL
ncbi:MAG: FAD-binding protein [Anaerolineae bacterium]